MKRGLAILALLAFTAKAELSLEDIEARVALSAPAVGERRIDEIGWAKDIREALRLAREHQRPIFLFTHDGRMAAGRC